MSDSYSSSYDSSSYSSESEKKNVRPSPDSVEKEAPKPSVQEKKECCKEECCSGKCCDKCGECPFLRTMKSHLYSAITFKDKIAYGMMVALYVWIVLMALSHKNLLFKVLLTLGFLKLYIIAVNKFCEPSKYNEEADKAIKELKERKCPCKCPCKCPFNCECKYAKIGMYVLALLFSFLISGRVYIPVIAIIPVLAHWVDPVMNLPCVKKALEAAKPYVQKAKDALDKLLSKAKTTMEQKTAK